MPLPGEEFTNAALLRRCRDYPRGLYKIGVRADRVWSGPFALWRIAYSILGRAVLVVLFVVAALPGSLLF